MTSIHLFRHNGRPFTSVCRIERTGALYGNFTLKRNRDLKIYCFHLSWSLFLGKTLMGKITFSFFTSITSFRYKDGSNSMNVASTATCLETRTENNLKPKGRSKRWAGSFSPFKAKICFALTPESTLPENSFIIHTNKSEHLQTLRSQ